ncbi:hypothetical protein [Fluviicola taffensis]|uniref:Uncharacterized protein n=1 Tax=Fluviicola taffensis (strain DSM 16823 / NCIMB 13979 / RW262) TaxID=755732 RepID=F2IBJ7_FLUTR|nr:hypothetical protein [Fluviicola taffensis]AEA44305.1 hypothetical protein Fluta_2319 [Fluviicola taffensis DSM 16823]
MNQTELMFESLKIQIHAIASVLTDQQKERYNKEVNNAILSLSSTNSINYGNGGYSANYSTEEIKQIVAHLKASLYP